MSSIMRQHVVFQELDEHNYQLVHQAMLDFTNARNRDTLDEIWFVEHDPVFTLGRNGNASNLLQPSDIPVVQSDRDGDITYHGPGQLVIYCLMDLSRLNLGVKSLVNKLEGMVIRYLSSFDVTGHRIEKAPGVYVDNKKLASLGLRVRHGCSFHGIAINIDMDLTPFSYIHPCGLTNMQAVQLKQLGVQLTLNQVACDFTELIKDEFYT